jgi:hypothetical protein
VLQTYPRHCWEKIKFRSGWEGRGGVTLAITIAIASYDCIRVEQGGK